MKIMNAVLVASLFANSFGWNPVQSLAFASGDGVIGGGLSQKKNGTYHLKDRSDPSVYTVISGAALYEDEKYRNLKIKEIIDAMKPYNYYFSMQLEREIKRMSFVLTTNFQGFETSSISKYSYSIGDWEVIGMRNLDQLDQRKAYGDRAKIALHSDLEQGYFFIHETLHSFIPAHVEDRQAKVEGLGKLIISAYERDHLVQADVDAAFQNVFDVSTVSRKLLGEALDPKTPPFTADDIKEVIQSMGGSWWPLASAQEQLGLASPEEAYVRFYKKTGVLRFLDFQSDLSHKIFMKRDFKNRAVHIGACTLKAESSFFVRWGVEFVSKKLIMTVTNRHTKVQKTIIDDQPPHYPPAEDEDRYGHWNSSFELLPMIDSERGGIWLNWQPQVQALISSGFCDNYPVTQQK